MTAHERTPTLAYHELESQYRYRRSRRLTAAVVLGYKSKSRISGTFRSRMKRALVWVLGSWLGWVALVQGARADGAEPDFEAAARAYREGQTAQRESRPAEAARWFELADSIAPTPQAL